MTPRKVSLEREKTRLAKTLRSEMAIHGKTILTSEETKAIFPKWHVNTTFNHFLLTASKSTSRYAPQGFGFACQNPLRTTLDGEPKNSLIFVPADDAGEVFGIDFGGLEIEAMVGEFCTKILEGIDFFIPAASYSQALTMSDILLRVTCTDHKPGKNKNYACKMGAQVFESHVNNRGRGGVDYWILDFNHAKASPARLKEFRRDCARQAFPDEEFQPDFFFRLSAPLMALAKLCEQGNHMTS